jgi:hypothetical protein
MHYEARVAILLATASHSWFISSSQRGACLLQLFGLPKDYNQTDIFEIMADSWYCLQPTGDSPTRAQVFDCLAAGTVLPSDVAMASVTMFRRPCQHA